MADPIRAAVVQGSDVINVILVNTLDDEQAFRQAGLIPPLAQLVECPETVEVDGLPWGIGPGATYDQGTGEFTPAPPPPDPNAPDGEPDITLPDDESDNPTTLPSRGRPKLRKRPKK
jgi:hypothetical protein